MIPDFYDGEFLPEGIHEATWLEVQDRFGFSDARRKLCNQMSGFIQQARGCGFRAVYLFGSFISSKKDPNDIDLMWVFRSGTFDYFSDRCRELLDYGTMKKRWNWDMWCCSDAPEIIEDMLSGWGMNKDHTKHRGIVKIDLEKFEGLIL